MAENSNIRLLQITLKIGDAKSHTKMEIAADEDPGANPAAAAFKASGLAGQNKDLFYEIVDKFRAAYPGKTPITLTVDGKKIVVSNPGAEVAKEAAESMHGELTDRAQSHLEVVGEAFPTLPPALQTKIKSMIAGVAAELAKLNKKIE